MLITFPTTVDTTVNIASALAIITLLIPSQIILTVSPIAENRSPIAFNIGAKKLYIGVQTLVLNQLARPLKKFVTLFHNSTKKSPIPNIALWNHSLISSQCVAIVTPKAAIATTAAATNPPINAPANTLTPANRAIPIPISIPPPITSALAIPYFCNVALSHPFCSNTVLSASNPKTPPTATNAAPAAIANPPNILSHGIFVIPNVDNAFLKLARSIKAFVNSFPIFHVNNPAPIANTIGKIFLRFSRALSIFLLNLSVKLDNASYSGNAAAKSPAPTPPAPLVPLPASLAFSWTTFNSSNGANIVCNSFLVFFADLPMSPIPDDTFPNPADIFGISALISGNLNPKKDAILLANAVNACVNTII